MNESPKRLRLARLPTPIEHLPRLSAQVGKEIYLWRDDLTGFVESGNKVRKLEFLLADALDKGATRIITAGGVQSNHTRATAFLARRLGLAVSIVVREPKQSRARRKPLTGNLLLNRICGADLTFVSYADYQAAGAVYWPFLDREADKSRRRGEKPYVIPEGGSVPLGCWGYLSAVEEMLASWEAAGTGSRHPDALFCALGSGGTHAGLHLGYERHGLPVNTLWAVNVCDSAAYFQKRVGSLVDQTAADYQLPLKNRSLQILDGHAGAGYGLASDDDLRFYIELATQEGVLLDPVYTGKAFQGMLAEIRHDPSRFGRSILFLHSGGTFAIFAYQQEFARVLPATDA